MAPREQHGDGTLLKETLLVGGGLAIDKKVTVSPCLTWVLSTERSMERLSHVGEKGVFTLSLTPVA